MIFNKITAFCAVYFLAVIFIINAEAPAICAQIVINTEKSTAPEKYPSAATILQEMLKAVSKLSVVEYEVEVNEERPLLYYKMTKVQAKTKIIAANSPLRAVVKLQGAETYEAFVLNGDIMQYSAAGESGESNLSKSFKPLAALLDFNQTWRLLLDREFFAKIIEDGRLLYGGQQIIGGDLCDVVIHVTSNSQRETITTNYYWISTTTKLPRARQTLTMTKRGKSLLPQSIINITNQNPQVTPVTFAYKPTEKDSVVPPEPKEDKKSENSDRELSALIGKQLPILIVNDTSFQKVKLSDVIDKPTLITFWATWCGPCLKEMPFFQKLVDKHGGKFQVVAVATSEQNISAATGFIKKHPEYKFTFMLDPDADREISVMKKALGGVEGLPTNLLVDRGGKIISAWLGERKETEWTELIDKSVNK